ncbi:MAG TPA: AP2 domain-containing protein [Candidatus Brocadiaceae bacterium]|nr:AP2 domain-containing protein [Candidatus Brocadiaceae bacterium]
MENLRFTDLSHNLANRPKRINGTSEFKGVSYHKIHKKWQARVGHNGKAFLGYFGTEEAAALAYNQAAIKIYGEFAYLNQVERKD